LEAAGVDRCPECGSAKLISDLSSGEVVCGGCGLVLQDSAAEGWPRRHFPGDGEDEGYYGASISFAVPDKGLLTVIDGEGRDARGRRVRIGGRLKRLRKWQFWASVHTVGERSIAKGMVEVNRLSDVLLLPRPVREEAAVICRRAVKTGLMRGRSALALAAASVYAACRLRGIPRTLKEVAGASRAAGKDVGRSYRVIVRELGLKVPLDEPSAYVGKIAGALSLSGDAVREAFAILEEVKKRRLLIGRIPQAVAAAAVYLAARLAGKGVAQSEVAKAARVTEVTVRSCVKVLENFLSIPGRRRLKSASRRASSRRGRTPPCSL